jgi:predicted nucleotidyltransferase
MLAQTVGILGRIAVALEGVDQVDAAFVYGSWAARYHGEPGPAPNDIDVVVVGRTSLRAVRSALRDAGTPLRVDINPIVIEPARWNAKKPEPFIAQLRNHPLVEIPLRRT